MMFDLFKKEEINLLKERITRLEEENRKLSLQLEKREEKARKTLSTKQEVDHELNEASQRISSLENELHKLKKETSSELNFRFSESVPVHKLEEMLSMLGSIQTKTSSLITVYLANDETLKNIESNIISQIDNNSQYLVEKISSSTGKAIFYDTAQIIKLVIIPVFPVLHSEGVIDTRFKIGPLKNTFESEKTLVLNAHAGETFIGILEQNTFVEHSVIRSSVMGKHSKGGWSQKRFQALVEEDVRHHADKVRDALLPMIEKNKDIRFVIAGGEGKLIKMILEEYDYPLVMKSIDSQALNPQQVQREAMAVRMYGI